MNTLTVYNPNNLPTIPYTMLNDFQGDLKEAMTPEALEKLRNSLKKHGVFVPKFVWIDSEGRFNILDGHQTKQGLASIEADGWDIPPIPYIVIDAASREDAAEKLLQINSSYAKINQNTTWLESFDFAVDLSEILRGVEIPELQNVLTSFDFGEIPSAEKQETSQKEKLVTCPKCGFEYVNE